MPNADITQPALGPEHLPVWARFNFDQSNPSHIDYYDYI
jgi:hypothetical protein